MFSLQVSTDGALIPADAKRLPTCAKPRTTLELAAECGRRRPIRSKRNAYVCLRRVFFLTLILSTGVHSALGQAQTTGQWSTLPYTMPINPVHAALLRTGNVLIVSGSGNDQLNTNLTAALWNRQAGTITVQTVPFDMFCNGTVILPDGRPFILGGTEAYDPFFGLPNTATYDPATGLFTNQQSMAHGRWYPTATVLGNGSVMVYSGAISGEDSPTRSLAGSTNTTVEIYTVGTGWSQEYAGSWTPPLYPRLHLLPNGTVFYSAPTPIIGHLSILPATLGRWTWRIQFSAETAATARRCCCR